MNNDMGLETCLVGIKDVIERFQHIAEKKREQKRPNLAKTVGQRGSKHNIQIMAIYLQDFKLVRAHFCRFAKFLLLVVCCMSRLPISVKKPPNLCFKILSSYHLK